MGDVIAHLTNERLLNGRERLQKSRIKKWLYETQLQLMAV